MCSRRKRTAFTPIQRQKLEAAYEGGLKSVAAVNLPAISDLASSLDLEIDVVKIMNMVKVMVCLMPPMLFEKKLA